MSCESCYSVNFCGHYSFQSPLDHPGFSAPTNVIVSVLLYVESNCPVLLCPVIFHFSIFNTIFFSSKFAQFTNVVDVYFLGIGRVVSRVGSRGLWAKIFDMAYG